MTPRRTLGLYCFHISQLMTHPAIYTILFTFQLCYKPLGILHRVTKSQKVHISNHDGFKKFHNFNFVWYRSQDLLEREQSSKNFPLPQSIFLRTIDLLFFKQIVRFLFSDYHLFIKYLQGNLISHDRSNGRSLSTSRLVKEYYFLIYLSIKVGR